MFSVSHNNTIQITRGDTATVAIFINAGTPLEMERYSLQERDAVYIGIMEPNQRFEDAIMKYKLTIEDVNLDGDPEWKIRAKDTEFLEPGTYFYEIKLSRANDLMVDTIVSKTYFYIQD